MRISICMIVRDEAENLKKCLDALLPIIFRQWCELVIVDTGSKDKTKLVALRYTKNVYDYKWDNDFSAARNFSISKAKGTYLLIVDADEVLAQESLYKLEEVCTLDNLEPSVFVTQRNFVDSTQTGYMDMLTPKIFERKDFKFEGIVHNIAKNKAPLRFESGIIFLHSGYEFMDNRTLAEKKVSRSLPLLKTAFKKKPNDLHILTHILKTLYIAERWKQVLKYGRTWRRLMKEQKYHDGLYSFLEGYINIVGSYVVLNKIKEAENAARECEKYFGKVAALQILLGNYWSTKDDKKASMYFEESVKITMSKKTTAQRLIANDGKFFMPVVLCWLAQYYFEIRQYEKAGEFLNTGILFNMEIRGSLRWDVWNTAKGMQQLK